MPDITKCIGTYCAIKEKCFRYTSTASQFNQSYDNFKPNEGDSYKDVVDNPEKYCDKYIN